ncbi:hypothetical protein NG696_12055 [Pseudarthrobacter sp. HLT1-5]|nr:hypothetical protein [Pseudarthrobacter sp. HLT1-5]
MAIDLTTDLIRQNLAVTLLPSRTAPRRPAPVSLPIADEPSRDEYVPGVTSIPALPPMPSSTSSSKQNRRNSTARIHPTPGQQVMGEACGAEAQFSAEDGAVLLRRHLMAAHRQ